MNLEVKKNKSNYEVNIFHSKTSGSSYTNIIDKDPNKIAQILIDLYTMDFPIEKAVNIFLRRIKKEDWLGLG